MLAWFAKQDDLTEAFAKGEDVYKKMASRIYDVPEEDITKNRGLSVRQLYWVQAMAWGR